MSYIHCTVEVGRSRREFIAGRVKIIGLGCRVMFCTVCQAMMKILQRRRRSRVQLDNVGTDGEAG